MRQKGIVKWQAKRFVYSVMKNVPYKVKQKVTF